MLWQRFHHRDGSVREVFRLQSLQRRHVPTAEATPPAHIYQWSHWRDAAGGFEPSNDNLLVELRSPPPEEGAPAQGDSQTVRTRGAWTFTHTIDGGAYEDWRMETPRLRFSYMVDEQHTAARRLQIWRGPMDQPERLAGEGALEPMSTETIVGQRCTWYDLGSPSHSSTTGCRTSDGILLARKHVCDGARGGHCYFDVRAIRLSRDPISDAAMTPPQQAFVWPGAVSR